VSSQVDRLLTILADGEEHSQLELYARSLGAVHSVIDKARKRGYVIARRREWRDGRQLHWYRLAGRPPVPLVTGAPARPCGRCGEPLEPVTQLCAVCRVRELAGDLELVDDELAQQLEGWAA
jgi:hypothetical protein